MSCVRGTTFTWLRVYPVGCPSPTGLAVSLSSAISTGASATLAATGAATTRAVAVVMADLAATETVDLRAMCLDWVQVRFDRTQVRLDHTQVHRLGAPNLS